MRTVAGTARKGYVLVRLSVCLLASLISRVTLQIEPLVPADGGPPILLNRGWVPEEWKARPPHTLSLLFPHSLTLSALAQEEHARSPPPPSCVSVKGLLRASEKPSAFVPPNSGAEWFWIDVPALAAAAHLPPSTRLVEVINPSPVAASPGSPAVTPLQASGSYPSVRARTPVTRCMRVSDPMRTFPSRRTRRRFCAGP